ncbi:TetR/AcrR family transcriptional regulator [Parvibaculum sp.]|uniref:TetR/AcrR family transcriptional regulator n=1 Tax=Parvibaculum sp. TaxID=2024848 RepID=UPI00391917A2
MAGKRIDLKTVKSAARHRTAEASEREAAILAAAARIFGARGFHAARTADIARAARTTERTLFKYFPSKAELFGRAMLPALMNVTIEAGFSETEALFAQGTPSFAEWQDGLLRTRFEKTRATAPEVKMLLVTILTDDAVRRWFVDNWRGRVWESAVAAVAGFQARGLVRDDLPPETAARAIISLNLGFVAARLLLAPETECDEETELSLTTRMVTDLLQAK